jgi:hypothetical protein
MDKQQTAVEWCIDELYKLNVKFLNSRYGNQMTILEYSDCKEQIKKKAKEMEKEMTVKLYNDYENYLEEAFNNQNGGQAVILSFKEFYELTYGGNK